MADMDFEQELYNDIINNPNVLENNRVFSLVKAHDEVVTKLIDYYIGLYEINKVKLNPTLNYLPIFKLFFKNTYFNKQLIGSILSDITIINDPCLTRYLLEDYTILSKIYNKDSDLVMTFLDSLKHESVDLIKSLKLKIKYENRTQEEIDRDELYNVYVFIGYTKLEEITQNKEKLYRKKLGIERMVKTDKYNLDDLKRIESMKKRAMFKSNGDDVLYGVYIPEYLMDVDYISPEDVDPETLKYIDDNKFQLK